MSDAEVFFKKAADMERGKGEFFLFICLFHSFHVLFSESPRRFLNLATFYSRFLGDSKRAKSQFERYKVMHSSSLKISSEKLVFESKLPSCNQSDSTDLYEDIDSYYYDNSFCPDEDY